jgi:hypothetical protein
MVEDILKISKQNYIGLMIDDSTNEPRLKIIDLTERKLTEIKKMVNELATLEERS